MNSVFRPRNLGEFYYKSSLRYIFFYIRENLLVLKGSLFSSVLAARFKADFSKSFYTTIQCKNASYPANLSSI